MKQQDLNELFSLALDLTCCKCKLAFNQANSHPFLICKKQHLCCEKCFQQLGRNPLFHNDISLCPQCSQNIVLSQINQLKIFQNFLYFKRLLQEKIASTSANSKKSQGQDCEQDSGQDSQQQITMRRKIGKKQTKMRKISSKESIKCHPKFKNLEVLYLNQAQDHFLEGNYVKAISICKKIIKNNPEESLNFKGFGGRQDLVGYQQQYIRSFYACHMKNVQRRSPLDLLSLVLLINSEYEEDKQFFLQLLKNDDQNYQLHYCLGILEQNFGKFDDAIIRFEKVKSLNSNFQKAQQNLAFIYYAKGNRSKARQYAIQSFVTNQNNVFSSYIIAITNQNQDERISDLIALIKKAPYYLVPQHQLGQIYLAMQQYDKAIKCFQNCLQKSKDYDVAKISLGLAYLKKQQPQKAIILMQQSDLINKNELEIQILATAYVKVRRFKQSHQMIDLWTKINSKNPKIDYALVDLYQAEENYQLLIKTVKRIWNNNPKEHQACRYIAEIYLKISNCQKAMKWAEQYHRKEPSDGQIFLKIADHCLQQKNFQTALSLYNRYYKIEGLFRPVVTKIISIYNQMDDFEESLNWAKKWNQLERSNPDTYDAIAQINKLISEKIRKNEWEPKKRRHLN